LAGNWPARLLAVLKAKLGQNKFIFISSMQFPIRLLALANIYKLIPWQIKIHSLVRLEPTGKFNQRVVYFKYIYAGV